MHALRSLQWPRAAMVGIVGLIRRPRHENMYGVLANTIALMRCLDQRHRPKDKSWDGERKASASERPSTVLPINSGIARRCS